MGNTLDQIVRVDIDLNQPPMDEKSFGVALLVGPPPAIRRNPDWTVLENSVPPVGTYRADDVKSAGFVSIGVEADPIGGAARVGFSQMPAPERVVIAVQQRVEFDAELYSCTVMDDITGILGGATDPDPNAGPFLVAQYPTPIGTTATVTRNGEVFNGAVSITTGSVQYSIISLESENTATFDITLPESISAQGRTIQLEYVARWNADIAEVMSIQLINASQFEPIEDTLGRALDYGGWYGIAEAGIDPADHERIMQWAEAQEAVASFPLVSLDALKPIYYRSFVIDPRTRDKQDFEDVPGDNRYIHVAYLCRFLAYQPGSVTWVHKSLSVIEPGRFSGTHKAALEKANVSYYITVAGNGNAMGGKTLAGEWIDVIHFRDWLKNDMQLRVFTLLRVNPKVPYTDPGITLVKNQMEDSLKQGQVYGGIAPDEFTEDGDRVPGYVTSVPLASSLTPTQKASRVLRDCTFAARLAGAIHAVEIRGSLVYELPVAA